MTKINTNALIDYFYPSVEAIKNPSKHADICLKGITELDKLNAPAAHPDGFEAISQDHLERLSRGVITERNSNPYWQLLRTTINAPYFPQKPELILTYLLLVKKWQGFIPLGSREAASMIEPLRALTTFFRVTENPLYIYLLAEEVHPRYLYDGERLWRMTQAISEHKISADTMTNTNTLATFYDTLPNELQQEFEFVIASFCHTYTETRSETHGVANHAALLIMPSPSTEGYTPTHAALQAAHHFNAVHELAKFTRSPSSNRESSPLHTLHHTLHLYPSINKPTFISPFVSYRKFYRLIMHAMFVDESPNDFNHCLDTAIALGYKQPKFNVDTLEMIEVNRTIQHCLLNSSDFTAEKIEGLIQKSRLLVERLNWDFTKTREDAARDMNMMEPPIEKTFDTYLKWRSLANLYFLFCVHPETIPTVREDIVRVCEIISQSESRLIDSAIRDTFITFFLEKLNDEDKFLVKKTLHRSRIPNLPKDADFTAAEAALLNEEEFEKQLNFHMAINRVYPYAISERFSKSVAPTNPAFLSRLLKSDTQWSFPSLLFLLRVNGVDLDLTDANTLQRFLAFSMLGLNTDIYNLPSNMVGHGSTYQSALIRTLIESDFSQASSCIHGWDANALIDDFGFDDAKQTKLSDIRGASFEANRLAKKHLGSKLAEGFGRHELKQAYMYYIRNEKTMQLALRQRMLLGKPCLMLNVLQSHASDSTLKETKELLEVRALMHRVPVSADTLNALRANVADGQPVCARSALLLLALADNQDTNVLTRHLINESITTPEAKADIIDALKLLSPDQISALKFKLNTLVTESKANKATIQSLIDNNKSEQCPLLLALKVGKTNHKIEKHGNFYAKLDQFLHHPEEVSAKNLKEYGLFSRGDQLLPENQDKGALPLKSLEPKR